MKYSLDNQHGVVLIAGLMILVILSLLGITAMQTSTIEEKMANNMGQRQVALQAAESGLRSAEAQMYGYAILPGFNGTNGLYQPAAVGSTPRWESVDWSTPAEYIQYQAADLSTTPPTPEIKCIVEYMAEIAGEGSDSVKLKANTTNLDMLRITSRGVSPNGLAVVILQTTFLR